MPAKLIETNKEEFAKTAVDPITLDIIEHALRNARVEMDATLFRTALSPSIREQGDAFPLIADRSGKMIVGQFGSFIDGFLRLYDGEIEEGDVILLSDPYSCEGAVSHNNDQLIIMPIYRRGRIITWAAMFGHMTDIGGKVPGSLPTDAASIFEEGLRLPPVKLYRKGEFQEDILKIAMYQSRVPEWYKADLHAIVASCRVAALRIDEICDRFGEDVFVSAMDELLLRNHRAMKQLINQAIGEEPVSFEDYVCDDGLGNGPFKIKCTMWREGDKVILDFDGTDPQSDSSINFYLNENMFKMFFGRPAAPSTGPARLVFVRTRSVYHLRVRFLAKYFGLIYRHHHPCRFRFTRHKPRPACGNPVLGESSRGCRSGSRPPGCPPPPSHPGSPSGTPLRTSRSATDVRQTRCRSLGHGHPC